jgi:hypothetical protein
MKIRINILLIAFSLYFGQTLYAQTSFPKNTDDKKIVSAIFEGTWVEKDTTCRWIPNFSESIQFDSNPKDTLLTKIDTIFKYKEYDLKKIILTSTFKFNNVCHACQPYLGMIELRFDEVNDSYIIERVNKYITGYGTWGEAPKKRSLFQLGEDIYCVKITEYSSGGGREVGVTSLYKEGKKIFSFYCYDSNSDGVEFDYQKYKFSSNIRFDKKSNTIKITKTGKEQTESGKIVGVNTISSYKYDGEFLIREYTRNSKINK